MQKLGSLFLYLAEDEPTYGTGDSNCDREKLPRVGRWFKMIKLGYNIV